LTVMHTPSLCKIGDDVKVSFTNGKVYSEKFDPKNLIKVSKGSDLAVYHFQNVEIPMAPDSRHQFIQYVPKESQEVEVLRSFVISKHVARATGPFGYKNVNGEEIIHNGGLKVPKQLGKGNSGSIMVIPGINRIVGVQVSQNLTDTQFEHITRDHLPDEIAIETPCEATGLKQIGKATKILNQNGKTSFKPSMLSTYFTAMFATNYLPSVLYAKDPRMEEPCDDVLKKSMNGYDREYAHLDPHISQQVVDELSFKIMLLELETDVY